MRLIALVSTMFVLACGPDARSGPDGGGSGSDGGGPQCVAGQHQCLAGAYEVCSNGTWIVQEQCPEACDANLGCVQCNPGLNVCQDGNVHSCESNGMVGGQVEECSGENICTNGTCQNACMAAAMSRSYTGCEYWAVDLDNAIEVNNLAPCTAAQGVAKMLPNVCVNGTATAGACDPPNNTCPSGFTCQPANVCVLDAQGAPFAIVVSNPQARAVDVTVTGPNGETFMASVPAGAVQPLMPQMNGIPDQSIDGSGIARKAYKVTSNLPIVAYQFNPLENVNVFSNDASLLIPRAAFDVEYYTLSRPSVNRRTTAPGKNPYLGYASIVAWEDNTMIEVTPKVAVLAGPGFTAINANQTAMFTLNAHEVLTIQAAGTGDLTGTRIKAAAGSTTSFGVFGGHEAINFGETTPPPGLLIPAGPCCADHLEDMMFPTSTWGKTFAIARTQSRGAGEKDVLRILAQKPSTTISFMPSAIGTCNTLNAGDYCEVKIDADTVLTATEPVLVGHFIQSALWQDQFIGGTVPMNLADSGDPSMAVAVPTEQYRADYTVLVPAQYEKNYLSITAPMTSGAIFVDGTMVNTTQFGQYKAVRHPVAAGQHKITCVGGCGVEVYGFDEAVSYMFAGGLDLKQIVIQ